jgi:hypothetical protein
MLEHKLDGFYVDVGCSDAEFHSNTFGLEALGWTGLLVDLLPGCKDRKGTFVLADASRPSPELVNQYNALPEVVDYLSLDVDAATLPAFGHLPWGRVRFRVATIETDVYRKGEKERDSIRAYLDRYGYELVCGDVIVEWPQGQFVKFEDWFADPGLVMPERIKRFQSVGKFWKEIIK